MKPKQIFLFLIIVLFTLFILGFIFPKDGIKITDNLKIKFFRSADLFTESKTSYADISGIIKEKYISEDSLFADIKNNTVSATVPWDTIRANSDSLKKKISGIEYAPGKTKVLHKAFKAMREAEKKNRLVRVLHYGDSQIEGDRITSLLRNRLQRKFGGMGVGLVPAKQVYDFSYSLLQENKGDWYRYTVYGNRDTNLVHNRYGALASFTMFSPAYPYSENDSINHAASVSFSSSPYGFSNTKSFQQCRVFFGYNPQPFIYELYNSETLLEADFVPVRNQLSMLSWTFDEPKSNLSIHFQGSHSPEIYAIALDGLNGVAVDNIAMRGSAGLVFSKMDKNLLKQMYDELKVKMVILQFGGNVIPYLGDNCAYYERLFYKQLKTLREISPDLGIIVIGVADMSYNEHGRYVSYPNIEKIRDALKQATFKADGAYWDMYKAMGGHNSMPSWVFANPPLASTDFVHFTAKGAIIIAQMFYNALYYEYRKFENA